MTPQYPQKAVSLETDNGIFLIQSFCTPEQIDALQFESPPFEEGHYRPVVTKKARLIQTAAQKDVNVTLAFRKTGEIVGLGILENPAPQDRWSRVGERMMEVSIIEVRRPWRRIGLARHILHLTLDLKWTGFFGPVVKSQNLCYWREREVRKCERVSVRNLWERLPWRRSRVT